MLPVIWSKRAQDDLLRVMRYIAKRNQAAATRLGRKLEDSAQNLQHHPYLFKTSERMPGCREIVAHPNYLVIYQVRAAQIRVLRVLHARQQFPADEN